MSAVTPSEIVEATATAYGFDVELVRAGGPDPLDRREQRTRLQARLVAAYLIDRHRTVNAEQIIHALGLSFTDDSRELVALALAWVPASIRLDETLARRVERAETRVDAIHERRIGNANTPRLKRAQLEVYA